MVLFFKKFSTLFKRYWGLLIAAIVAVVSAILLIEQKESFSKTVKRLNDAHDEELKKIEEARLEERRRHEENQKLLQESLKIIRDQYDSSQVELKKKMEMQVKKLVEEYSDDPVELAKKLSEVTGIPVSGEK